LSWFQEALDRNRKQRERWRDVPASSVAILMGMAFCLFASVGMLTQLNTRLGTHWLAIVTPFLSGAFAAAILWISVRRNLWWVFGAVLAFLVVFCSLAFYLRKHPPGGLAVPAEIQPWLTTTATLVTMLITCSWGLALWFVGREGQRLFRVQTEMRLAGEIHQALVPAIETRIGDFEFYGVSVPSGMVGGDLVDVLARGTRWLAYVVDVSGHGVSAGVLMAMIKSSIHTTLRFQPKLDGLLEEVNRVLCDLKTANMFATCGVIAFSPEGGLRYALAGHLPILRLRDRKIEVLSESNLPLGVVPDTGFKAASCGMETGDVLVVVTDGLTEILGRDGEELGLSQIAQVLRDCDGHSPRRIAEEILRGVNRGSPQRDDQSLLVVRCVSN
jgi:sigma-B regulation protein RsbU (phosphoserine phosphatase)